MSRIKTLKVLIGPSLVGKTTWAKQQDAYIVSRDSERESLFGQYRMGTSREEDMISLIIENKVKTMLQLGDVILDNTHLKQEYITDIIETYPNVNIKFIVFDVPSKEELIKRNQARFLETGKLIPEKVIHKQLKDYENLNIPDDIYVRDVKIDSRIRKLQLFDNTKKPCIICDLDGTLSLLNNRDPYCGEKCIGDELNTPVRDILHKFKDDTTIILFSGRNSDNGGKEATEQWLSNNNIQYDLLVMREEGDNRPDTIIKERMYKEHIENQYFVKFILDDRPCVIRMWNKLNLPVFNVNPCEGEF